MTRLVALTLAAGLSAGAALACALPPPEASACAAIRVDAAHICVDDPEAPGGYRIVERAATDPSVPDCGGEACGRPLAPAPVATPAVQVLHWLAGA
jgi:hypothetical protein